MKYIHSILILTKILKLNDSNTPESSTITMPEQQKNQNYWSGTSDYGDEKNKMCVMYVF